MTRQQKITIIVNGVLVAVSVRQYLHIRKTERAKRLQIQHDLLINLQAIKLGGSRMEENIKNGKRYESIEHMMNDLSFEVIAAHYE